MIDTAIEWAHHTLNWWWGCAKVSEACRFCYAESMAKLFGRGRCVWGPAGLRWIRENAMRDAIKIHDLSKASGLRQRVFVNSMSDTFEDHPGLVEARALALDTMEAMPHAHWLLLTKRPENVRRMVPRHWLTRWPAHIWVGATVENQQAADHRIPELLEIPAEVHFLSCEPLLGPVNLSYRCLEVAADWVICGGESGPHARPMHPDWARSLRDQCQNAGVPFFFKQWGEFAPRIVNPPEMTARGLKFPDKEILTKFGKKAAGREIDGREWNDVPDAEALVAR